VDDVEEWTIEAIADKIIDAKIDQLNEEIVILSTIKRKIGKEEWQAIQAKI
jgi:alpha-N-acetylglucosamine transferase